VDRVAMGSPYTPAAAKLYGKYDLNDRSAYYNSPETQAAALEHDLAEARGMIETINAMSAGQPEFFLDNETPKGRYGHLWWVGHEPQFASWHDYDQEFDHWMCKHPDALQGRDEPMPYERRPYLQIVAEQRARGAVGVWAHPTSWWTGSDGRFITNIATEMPIHALADGFVDGVVIMGYHPRRPEYEGIWRALLDRDLRAPGYAEMDIGLSEERLNDRTHPMCSVLSHEESSLSWQEQIQMLRCGAFYCSSGPDVHLTVDGLGMGETVESSSFLSHQARLNVTSTAQVSFALIEIVGRGGQVLWSQADCRPGEYVIPIAGVEEFGYVYARVTGRQQGTCNGKLNRLLEYAITNPVYLRARHRPIREGAVTQLNLRIEADSPWVGGTLAFESADGHQLDFCTVRQGAISLTLPASARLTFTNELRRETQYLINHNPELASLQRYLYRGRWRSDFQAAVSGEVPVEAWRIDEMEAALAQLSLTR